MASLSTPPDMTSFCHVVFPGHVQKQQQLRLNKKINRLLIFMYNPRALMRIIYISHYHARIQKCLSNSDNVFYEGKGYPNSILSGLSWERADDGPTLNAGLVAFRFSADPD